jgi:hypothetical protein
MFAGILFAVVLTPVALMLWILYRSMRRGGPLQTGNGRT